MPKILVPQGLAGFRLEHPASIFSAGSYYFRGQAPHKALAKKNENASSYTTQNQHVAQCDTPSPWPFSQMPTLEKLFSSGVNFDMGMLCAIPLMHQMHPEFFCA